MIKQFFNNWICISLIAGALYGADRLLKHISFNSFVKHQEELSSTHYIGRKKILFSVENLVVVSFGHVRNFGALWNVAASLNETVRIFLFVILPVAALAVLFYLDQTIHFGVFVKICLLSGALSNLYDRLMLGFVIDYIDIRVSLFSKDLFFPNFNLADVFIIVGILAILIRTKRKFSWKGK